MLSLLLTGANTDSDPKGLIGDIDEVAVFSKTLSATDVQNHYAVGKYSPNNYSETMKSSGADGIYSLDEANKYIYGLKKTGSWPPYEEITLSLSASCSESTSFALNPVNNKISFVIMDSDSSPRSQIEMQDDQVLQGDEQLVPTGVPYQGLCTLEWNNSNAKLSFLTTGSSHLWEGLRLMPNVQHSLRMVFDGSFASIQVIQLPYEDYSEIGIDGGHDIWVPEEIIFDTGRFPLDFRLRGGVGWSASLIDMHSSVQQVLLEDVQIAEYRSAPLRSKTPYSGAQIFKSGTPSRNAITAFSASDWGGSIVNDYTKSVTAWRVDTTGNKKYEGIKSGRFFLANPKNVKISFKVIVSVQIDAFLYCYETDEIIQIHSDYADSPDWITIEKTMDLERAGHYALYITSPSFGQWWVDEISASPQSIAWFARPDQESQWVPLKTVSDSKYGGVAFTHPGKTLQVRGVSKVLDGTISDVQIEPKYAELGKLVWRDEIDG